MNKTAIRSQIYTVFAQVFTYPQDDMVTMLLSGELETELRQIASELPYRCKLNHEQAQDESQITAGLSADESLSVLYSSKFEVGNPPVSLHEGAYNTQDRKKLLEDLFRFYEHFGLNFKNQKLTNSPDWLICELEFMHYLVFLETSIIDSEKQAALQRAQYDFLDLHLSKWLGALVKSLKAQKIEIYHRFCELLDDFTAAEKQYLAKFCA